MAKNSLVMLKILPPKKGTRKEYLDAYWQVKIELDRWYIDCEYFDSEAKATKFAENYVKAFCNPGTATIVYPKETKK